MQKKTETTPKTSRKRNNLRRGCMPALFLLVFLIPTVWIGYKGSQPMSVADAQGMTYWQFMLERLSAERSEDTFTCKVMYTVPFIVALPYFTTAYIWTGLYPESAWNKTLTPAPKYPHRPENLTWSQVPGEIWRLVEEISWGAWAEEAVQDRINSGCYLPPVTYPSDLEASSH